MIYIRNWPLLEKAIEHIIDDPEHYWQGEWRYTLPESPKGFTRSMEFDMAAAGKCGTTRCVAGWVAHLAGYTDCAYPQDRVYVMPPGSTTTDDGVTIVRAALAALGAHESVFSFEMVSDTNHLLFDGHLTWREILGNLRVMADNDGYELSDKIRREMEDPTV